MTTVPAPTARLEFGRWTTSELERASSLWCNAEVMRFLGGPYTHDEVVARLTTEVANDEMYGIQYWPVFVDREFAGCCGLKPMQDDLEIGFHFLPKFWGAGYASEAARAVIAHAEGRTLFAGHHPENDASRTLLTRLGFTQIGTHFFARTNLQHPWYRRSAD